MNIPLIIGAVFGIFLAGYLVGMFLGERIGAESEIGRTTFAAYCRINVNDVCRVMVDEIESVSHPTEVYHAALAVMDMYKKVYDQIYERYGR